MAKKPPPGFNTPFAKLPPIAKARAPAASPRVAAPAPSRSSEEDERLFEQAMRGVKPLSEVERRKRSTAIADPPAAIPRRSRAAADDALARADLADLVQKRDRFVIEEVGEAVAGLGPGIDRKLLQRLRAGDYPIDAELDLHGRTRVQASTDVERFVARARADGRRCVLVVHGRGNRSGPDGPVLGAALREWLSEGAMRRHVLAFTSAPPDRGGTGAMLILLRRG